MEGGGAEGPNNPTHQALIDTHTAMANKSTTGNDCPEGSERAYNDVRRTEPKVSTTQPIGEKDGSPDPFSVAGEWRRKLAFTSSDGQWEFRPLRLAREANDGSPDDDFQEYSEMMKDGEAWEQTNMAAMEDIRGWIRTTEDWITVGLFIDTDGGKKKLIGIGGVYRSYNEWPKLHCVIKSDKGEDGKPMYQGKGYGPKFMAAFLDKWWSLPREPVPGGLVVQTEFLTQEERNKSEVSERLCAMVPLDNEASSKLWQKLGYEYLGTWTLKVQKTDVKNPEKFTAIVEEEYGRKIDKLVVPHKYWQLKKPENS